MKEDSSLNLSDINVDEENNLPISDFKSELRILVVDDEPFNLMAMKTVLQCASKKAGFYEKIVEELTDYAPSGQKALDKIAKGVRYGLVLTDISMPMIDGNELAK